MTNASKPPTQDVHSWLSADIAKDKNIQSDVIRRWKAAPHTDDRCNCTSPAIDDVVFVISVEVASCSEKHGRLPSANPYK